MIRRSPRAASSLGTRGKVEDVALARPEAAVSPAVNAGSDPR